MQITIGSPQGHAIHQLIVHSLSRSLGLSTVFKHTIDLRKAPAIQPPVADMAERSNPLWASQSSTEVPFDRPPSYLEHVAKALAVEARKKAGPAP